MKFHRRRVVAEFYANTFCGILVWADLLKKDWRGVDCKNCLKNRGKVR